MEHEQSPEVYKAVFIGRLKDIGLGNPNGIPSKLAGATAEELADYTDMLIQQLELPTTTESFSCIDGREILQAADGSEPAVRLRRVGGSAANIGVAMNAGIEVSTTNGPIPAARQADRLSGTDRSAHTAGCGGANGEIADNIAISENPAVAAGIVSLLNIPEVGNYFEITEDDRIVEAVEAVRNRAEETAQIESGIGWDGQAYVNDVQNTEPGSVDELHYDLSDKNFHGHAEDAVVIIVGNKTLRHGIFVWNIRASKLAIDGFVRNTGANRLQVTVAEIAKHIAVTNRLPSEDTPLIILAA